MATSSASDAATRAPLSRERVFEAAVAYADEHGVADLSMRKLGTQLGVEAMSLYHHVAGKDEILDGMVDRVLTEIALTEPTGDWKADLRRRILDAREVMKRHRWAPAVIESRQTMTLPMLRYMDAVAGILLGGGFSVELMHHAMHVLGSRALGFTQELYEEDGGTDASLDTATTMPDEIARTFPNIAAIMEQIRHQEETIVGSGCDDDVEFRFALDIILDGLERHHDVERAIDR
jgi:AcrR family transcriptional regulator